MIHVEDHKAQIEGNIIEISDNVLGLMEALNKALSPDSEYGEFFWSSLFSVKNAEGSNPGMEFVHNLNKGFDVYREVIKNGENRN